MVKNKLIIQPKNILNLRWIICEDLWGSRAHQAKQVLMKEQMDKS